jgi:hypothetical protein
MAVFQDGINRKLKLTKLKQQAVELFNKSKTKEVADQAFKSKHLHVIEQEQKVIAQFANVQMFMHTSQGKPVTITISISISI